METRKDVIAMKGKKEGDVNSCKPMQRLPSFKPPRDLTLSGSTSAQISALKNYMKPSTKPGKRVYAPNINVVRKKGPNVNNVKKQDPQSTNDVKPAVKEPVKKVTQTKGATAVVQTEGVFSTGLAPGAKPRAGFASDHDTKPVLQKPKLNLNVKVSKKTEDSKLRTLLKDDFIDDPSIFPDITFIPSRLPKSFNAKSNPLVVNIDGAFDSLQMTMDKIVKSEPNAKADISESMNVFEDSDSPKMMLFEFPFIPDKEDLGEKKKAKRVNLPSGQSSEPEPAVKKRNHLSTVGDGLLGTLRIHENGNAYFIIGSNKIPMVTTKHVARQELISTHVDPKTHKGEIINLGTVDASFTCSTSFTDGVK